MTSKLARAALALGLLSLATCNRGAVAVIAVSGLPAGAARLDALVSLGGSDAAERPSFDLAGAPITPTTIYRFGVRLPAGAGGELVVSVGAFNDRGCLLTTRSARIPDVAALSPEDAISVALEDPLPTEYTAPGVCLSGAPIVGSIRQLPTDSGAGRQLVVKGWGFLRGATVQIGDRPPVVAERRSQTELALPEPTEAELPKPTGRLPVVASVKNPEVGAIQRPLDLLKVTFARRTYSLGAGLHPDSVALADLDGDGDLDLLLAAKDDPNTPTADPRRPGTRKGFVVVLRNGGDGQLPSRRDSQGSTAAPEIIDAGPAAQSVNAVDLNRDGKVDVAVLNSYQDPATGSRQESVMVLLQGAGAAGAASLGQARTYGAGEEPYQLVARDLDGDGVPDLAVVNTPFSMTRIGAEVSVLLNRGDGSFPDRSAYPGGTGIGFVVAEDFNKDRRPDLAVYGLKFVPEGAGLKALGGVHLLENQGGGTFPVRRDFFNEINPILTTLDVSVGYLVSADFDGDGNPDLVGSGRAIGSGTDVSAAVSVLRGTGDGRFAPSERYPSGMQPFFMAAGDLDGDGRTDLAVANSFFANPGSVTLLLNQLGQGGPRLFPLEGAPIPAYPTRDDDDRGFVGVDSGFIALGDLNGDCRLDMVVSSLGTVDYVDPTASRPGTVTVYLNTTPGAAACKR